MEVNLLNTKFDALKTKQDSEMKTRLEEEVKSSFFIAYIKSFIYKDTNKRCFVFTKEIPICIDKNTLFHLKINTFTKSLDFTIFLKLS